jgi:hypothetical protein
MRLPSGSHWTLSVITSAEYGAPFTSRASIGTRTPIFPSSTVNWSAWNATSCADAGATVNDANTHNFARCLMVIGSSFN